MKYFVFFMLVCVALASAAPQLLTWPGIVGPAVAPGLVTPWGGRTIVAGPTVVNGLAGARLVAPGYIGTTYI